MAALQFSETINRIGALLLFNDQVAIGVRHLYRDPAAKGAPLRFSGPAVVEAHKKVSPRYSDPPAREAVPLSNVPAVKGVHLLFNDPAAVEAHKKVPLRFSDPPVREAVPRYNDPAVKGVHLLFNDPAVVEAHKKVPPLSNGPAAEVVKAAQYSVVSQPKAKAQPKEAAVAAEKVLVAQSEKALRADNKVPFRKAIGDFSLQPKSDLPALLDVLWKRRESFQDLK